MEDRGFEIVEGVIGAAECGRLAAELSSRSRAGSRHLMSHPAVGSLARSESLMAMARRTLGPAALPYRATLFDKSAGRNWLVVWHQDTALPLATRVESPEWGPWSVKEGVTYAHAPTWALAKITALRVHLDDSTAANGPLRVIPGSHRAGLMSDEEVFRKARELPAVDCLVGRGGVLQMRPLLIHGSSKAAGDAPRRVIHLEYAAALEIGSGLRLVVA
ncbi:MAG: phytanoyl-CoA dioxygenase family protein [Planctomycetes bacterium]|nr:phytanoyl-CoA dioxygenase family protein [Planctomycetota bacterium]